VFHYDHFADHALLNMYWVYRVQTYYTDKNIKNFAINGSLTLERQYVQFSPGHREWDIIYVQGRNGQKQDNFGSKQH
jgi:hypothetical protein